SLIAITMTSVTITERTLENVFPHLMRPKHRQLGEKLVNQRIVMHGSVHFLWDTVYCRTSGIFSQSDLLTPVASLLGSLEDTSLAFEQALISADFRWKSC
ncbi:hypothetical protein PHMEG_00037532, partial [Phytophthora megakarya]